MNCVCGGPVTDHAKVYDCNFLPWTPALPFTLSGPCRKCGVVGGHDAPRCVLFRPRAMGSKGPYLLADGWTWDPQGGNLLAPPRMRPLTPAMVETPERVAYQVRLGQVRKYPGPNSYEIEWWKKYDRPQSAGKPEVM